MVPDGPKTSSCRMQTDSGGVKDKNDAIDERTDVSADSRDSAAEHEILQKIEALRERLQCCFMCETGAF